MALGHGNFLRGLEEFEGVLMRAHVRSLENEIFRVSLLVASYCLLDMFTINLIPHRLRYLWFNP